MATAVEQLLLPASAEEVHRNDAVVARLDRAADQLEALDVSDMDSLVQELNTLRLTCGQQTWRHLIADVISTHRVRELLHQEPLTRRAFLKPRGYPGDAVLLDLIYRTTVCVEPMTPVGTCIHDWAPSSEACKSVCERRAILANLIDRIARERSMPRILSLACGHLREAQLSEAVRTNAISEIVAVDQDSLSLDVVSRDLNHARITPMKASIRRFLVKPAIYGEFDLIYSAGLFDYLDDATARRLTRSMFDALKPGGTLLVANFAPELPDIGYMDAIMDWVLIYRDELGVAAFCDDLPADLISEHSMQRDSGGNVVYLTVRKC